MRLVHIATLAFALILPWSGALAGDLASDVRPFNVLVIHGYDPQLPAGLMQDQAMRRSLLANNAPRLTDIYAEYFDAARFQGGEIESLFLTTLRQKYATTQFDALVGVGRFGLKFVTRHRAELAPDAPIVFYTIWPDDLAGNALPRDTTGQFTGMDFGGTLALALALQPDAQRLVMVGRSPATLTSSRS